MGKLLVVDDDEALRGLMRLELGDDYEVIDSGEPEQGLSLALEHRPQAILLDLRMPNYSGYELLQAFTSLSLTQTIPVIIVSGEGGGQTREHCKQLGAAGYFEKPIDFVALRTCLRQTARSQRTPSRAEVRVRLRIPLKLAGTDSRGEQFSEVVTTENVSLSGFLCGSTAELSIDSMVDVSLVSRGDSYVGKAKIVHVDAKSAPLRRYGCRFMEKTGPWVLQ